MQPLSCPFCGSGRIAIPGTASNPDLPEQIRFCCYCVSCDAEGPCDPDREEAVRRWNNRFPVMRNEERDPRRTNKLP